MSEAVTVVKWYMCTYGRNYCILQIVQGGKVSWLSQIDRYVYRKTFPVKIVYAVGLGHARLATIQPRKLSNKLQFSSATAKLFHLKQSAIYDSSYILIMMSLPRGYGLYQE